MKGLRSGLKPETQKFLGIKSHSLNCEQIKKKATGVNFSGYTEDMQMAVNTFFFLNPSGFPHSSYESM